MTGAFLDDALDAVGIRRDTLVLSLANNHILDQGISGLKETGETLDRLGIRTIGVAGGSAVEAFAVGPLRVGLAAFTLWRNAGADLFAQRILTGWEPSRYAASTIASLDLACVVPHWDWEFRHFPRASTVGMAMQMASSGFGLIAGHHAHVLQPVGRAGEAVVAYGLGDFLGTALPRQPWPGRIGGIFVADVGTQGEMRGRVAGYSLYPFFRKRELDREHLLPIEALDKRLREKVVQRLALVLEGPDVG